MPELEAKLATIRAALVEHGLAAIRLRGLDWFTWATAGGSAAVLLAAETGIAELLVTAERALVLTTSIEAKRLRVEELPAGVTVRAAPWAAPAAIEALVAEAVTDGPVASDRPLAGEAPLPDGLVAAKRRLLPAEIDRYRALGRDAAEALTETLSAARPTWSEWELAGAGAAALWRRGIHPALTLVAGARRLPLYRHPTATGEPLGERAMLVVCGRRHGLYANITRFVSFRPPTEAEAARFEAVASVEAAAWAASTPGATLGAVYDAIVAAYAQAGHPGAEADHHQGGSTGYLSREQIALPGMATVIEAGSALAWNPSLPGAKIEDTVLVTDEGIEVLTVDPAWPAVTVEGRPRPTVLVRR